MKRLTFSFILCKLFFLLCLLQTQAAFSQTDSSQTPRGYSVLPIPFAAYDADLGAQFGAIVLVYNYGKNLFPQYRNKIYFNGSVYTSMAGAMKLTYDSGKEFHKMRFTAHTRFSHEECGAFYGFNGSQSNVNLNWANSNSSQYQSKLFYAVQSNQFRFIADGSLNLWEKVKFVTGISSWYVGLHESDVSFFRDFTKQNIPSTSDVPPLWNRYERLGILPSNELHGGWCHYLKLSLMRDSRDFEPNPRHGSRSEVLLSLASNGINLWPHAKITIAHVQFVPLHKRVTLAARGILQSTFLGHAPYFMQPYIHSALGFASVTGLGGNETLRGISQNRIVADGVMLANLELRCRALDFVVHRRGVWLGTSFFVDAGKAIKPIAIDMAVVQQRAQQQGILLSSVFTQETNDHLHISYGGGIKIGINETTILSGDIAWPHISDDGKMSLYLGVDFIF